MLRLAQWPSRAQGEDSFATIGRNLRFQFFNLNFDFESFSKFHRFHPSFLLNYWRSSPLERGTLIHKERPRSKKKFFRDVTRDRHAGRQAGGIDAYEVDERDSTAGHTSK